MMRQRASHVVAPYMALATLLFTHVAFIQECNATHTRDGNDTKRYELPVGMNLTKIHREAVDNISADNIREQLRYFTRIPHSTASAENHQLADYIQDKWQQYGVERVVLKKYDALVSVPEEPGYVTVRDSDGQVIFKSAGQEKPLLPEENSTRVLPPYSAYSPSGEVTGTLVYAYRGRHKDFQDLEDIGVNVTGKIVIFQYSKSNRASQVLRAQKNGAVGVILYSDPSEVACEGLDKVYPLYNWMPSTGVTRGNIKTTHYSGDPLTPGRPAVDGMYRIPIDEIKQELPQIPVLPISYGDMTYLMGTLDGKVPDDSWRGGLPVDYGIQSRSNNTTTVTLSVKNNLSIKPIYNVIGEIRGVEEPDQLVIVGCHRDAWVFGGTDGSSGTAALMEVARVLGELLKKGWRPRRTIVMASWGGEEMGTIGSTEWTEEHAKILSSRALAYINVDMSVDGNATFRAKSVPLMHKVIREAAKKVPGSRGTGTLYEDWVNASPSEESSALPLMERLAFSSDYISFYATQGVPSLDIRYTYDKVKTNTRNNPLYHTLHDTFDLMAAFIDPDFKLQQVTTRAWLQCILDLADSTIIPFGVTDYAVTIEKARDELVEEYGVQLEENKVTLEHFTYAVRNFSDAATRFQQEVDSVSEKDVYNIRRINQRLLLLERAFINYEDPPTLPNRRLRRHVFLQRPPGKKLPYMAGLLHAVRQTMKGKASWEDVKQQVSLLVYAIQSAAKLLSLNPI